MKLWMKVLIALVLGVTCGILLGEKAVYLKPLGTIFLSLINMIIVLLILSSMTVGVCSIHDPEKLGRIGGKTILIYTSTTLLAISGGLLFANLLPTGQDLGLTVSAQETTIPPSLSQLLLSMIPSNPVAALANGNILQIIVFSVFLGLAINFSGERGKPLLRGLASLADVMYRMTSLIMEFSPIGVFGIMAWVAGTFGAALLFPLLKFLGVYYLVCLFHFFGVYGFLLRGLGKLRLLPFMKGMGDAAVMALSTCSSAATLPVAFHCLQQNLGVSERISQFVMPLGITMNMNGSAIFQAMSAVFVAHAYGIALDWTHYLTLLMTAFLSALGTAGIPGGGFVMLSVVLSSVGLPLEALGILAGIDRLREMMSTTLNILGDAAVTVFIAKQEGELDETRYHHSPLIELEGQA